MMSQASQATAAFSARLTPRDQSLLLPFAIGAYLVCLVLSDFPRGLIVITGAGVAWNVLSILPRPHPAFHVLAVGIVTRTAEELYLFSLLIGSISLAATLVRAVLLLGLCASATILVMAFCAPLSATTEATRTASSFADLPTKVTVHETAVVIAGPSPAEPKTPSLRSGHAGTGRPLGRGKLAQQQ